MAPTSAPKTLANPNAVRPATVPISSVAAVATTPKKKTLLEHDYTQHGVKAAIAALAAAIVIGVITKVSGCWSSSAPEKLAPNATAASTRP